MERKCFGVIHPSNCWSDSHRKYNVTVTNSRDIARQMATVIARTMIIIALMAAHR